MSWAKFAMMRQPAGLNTFSSQRQIIVADAHFSYSADQLTALAKTALQLAQQAGASACEVDISEGYGQTVNVRQGAVETIEHHRDKGIGLTVYLGQHKGHASTSDFAPTAIADAVSAALNIARYTASDPCAGLADPAQLASDIPALDLYHPWALPVEEAITLAQTCEAAAFAADARIKNSEGASVSTQAGHFIYANSHGFCAGYPTARHSISCMVIAETDDDMQRDYWYSVHRRSEGLENASTIGHKAGLRAAARLGARSLPTTQAPVVFDASIASGLIGHFVTAVSGGSLYRKTSFLLDSLGQSIFAPCVDLYEEPHQLQGLGSCPFDSEGVATRTRTVVRQGVVEGYFLGSYSARKLGLQSTGNAGGSHNLRLTPTLNGGLHALLREMGTGLLVTELLGQGVNGVTGDYSRGAAGFWVENGVIAYPVHEITIAGNLRRMFQDIIAIGDDVLIHGNKQTGSILLREMTIAGQ